MIAGQGTRLNGITQEFTQGSYETSEKTLDMAIVGEGLFVVKGAPPTNAVTYSRNGAFTPLEDGRVVDTTGSPLQLLPVDADGNVTARTLAAAQDPTLPTASAAHPDADRANVTDGTDR